MTRKAGDFTTARGRGYRRAGSSSPDFEPCPELHEVVRYWSGKRGAEPLPSRRDFDPLLEVPHLVSNFLLIDVRGDAPRYLVRLQGVKVVAALEIDLTGKCLDELVPDHFDAVALEHLQRVVGTRAPQLFQGDLSWWGRGHVEFDAGLFPLSSDGNQVDMVLGAVFFRTHRAGRRRSAPW